MDPRNARPDILIQFNKERNEAFLTMDEDKIRAHQMKWNGTELPENKDVFWGSVHKAITGCGASLPLEFRKQSKAWLDKRGLKSLDDGDL